MTETESAVALKEWAAIEDALAIGRLSVLVRKGGIYEKRGGFEVEHRGFWIFPTGWHQNEHELRPEFRGHLGDTPRFPADQVALRVYCTVEASWRVEDLAALERLGDLQPFSPETLKSRFEYRGKPYLHVILVRAHGTAAPRVVPNTGAYEGCVSWVQLESPIDTADATPVLDPGAFADLRREVLARLGDAVASVR
ncbi:MAG TPA: DUF1802 family protein [Longimicrobium sp.]|nr:DUF1802 family protein [Longimicrobium sp.]